MANNLAAIGLFQNMEAKLLYSLATLRLYGCTAAVQRRGYAAI